MTSEDAFTDACVERNALPVVGKINQKQEDDAMWWLDLKMPTLDEIAQAQRDEAERGEIEPSDSKETNGVLTDPRTGRVYVPEVHRTRIVFFLHCVCGHVGVNRTQAAMTRKFCWPGMGLMWRTI
eukprot:GHVQ01012968.1.p3 GENE.GHVQ01012968.1~~GHVQ01012968.1.p3  ORF type:complete len:125 (+),score=14.45 GHVQ01012968.1:678-1052(+)